MKNINIGLVGCGRISEKHLEAILFHKKKFNLVAICDIEQKKIDNISITSIYDVVEKLFASANPVLSVIGPDASSLKKLNVNNLLN